MKQYTFIHDFRHIPKGSVISFNQKDTEELALYQQLKRHLKEKRDHA